jgi:hypothetical protein
MVPVGNFLLVSQSLQTVHIHEIRTSKIRKMKAQISIVPINRCVISVSTIILRVEKVDLNEL